jgi:S1-C subfamily serine protease
MSQVRVVSSDGRSWGADVVYFNADIDLAVLFVPGLGLTPLEPARDVADGDAAVIAGYPGGGPLDLRSARVVTRTAESPVFSDNIYGKPTKPREIFVVRGRVIPGNSGGPLLARDGRYAGVVFASSQQYKRTGFALTNKTVGQGLRSAADRTLPVSTGVCSR